jgi:hypothetical protein
VSSTLLVAVARVAAKRHGLEIMGAGVRGGPGQPGGEIYTAIVVTSKERATVVVDLEDGVGIGPVKIAGLSNQPLTTLEVDSEPIDIAVLVYRVGLRLAANDAGGLGRSVIIFIRVRIEKISGVSKTVGRPNSVGAERGCGWTTSWLTRGARYES